MVRLKRLSIRRISIVLICAMLHAAVAESALNLLQQSRNDSSAYAVTPPPVMDGAVPFLEQLKAIETLPKQTAQEEACCCDDTIIGVGRSLSHNTIDEVTNDLVTLTYTVFNKRATDVHSISLKSALGAGIQLTSATPVPLINSGTHEWRIDRLGPFENREIVLSLNIASAALNPPAPILMDSGASVEGTYKGRNAIARTLPAVLNTIPLDPEYLRATPDANKDDHYIREKAAELGYDPVRIYEFVRNEVGFESYVGSLRGSRGTLWSEAGNALDQASLLVALLRASGWPSRYAQGTLSTPLSQELILSMFPPVYNTVGVIPPDAELSDPANDPELLTETKNHYWVEVFDGSNFIPLDPCFGRSQIGQAFAPKMRHFAEVDDNLRHKVAIRLFPEFLGTALQQSDFAKTKVIDETFNTVESVGKPLSIGHFVSSTNNSSIPFGSFITHTYSPYILIGENDANIEDDEIRRGTDYQEIVFAFSSSVLTGLFLEIDSISPGGARETSYRTILDRIGTANRASDRLIDIGLTLDPLQSAIGNTDITTCFFPVGRIPMESIGTRWTRMLGGMTDINNSRKVIDKIVHSSGEDLTNEEQGQLPSLYRTFRNNSIINLETLVLSYQAASQIAIAQMESGYLMRSYHTSPRCFTASVKNSSTALDLEFDLLLNELRATPYPGQVNSISLFFETGRGLFETELESQLLSQITGIQTLSALESLTTNYVNRGGMVVITNSNLDDLDSTNLSVSSRTHVVRSARSGKWLFVPKGTPNGANQNEGWLELDPESGYLIGVNQDGLHGAFVGYVLLFSVQGATAVISGIAIGYSSATFTFLADFLNQFDHVLPVEEVIKRSKAKLALKIIGDIISLFEGRIEFEHLYERVTKCFFATQIDNTGVTYLQDPHEGDILSCLLDVAYNELGLEEHPDRSRFTLLAEIGVILGELYFLAWVTSTLPGDPPIFPFLSGNLPIHRQAVDKATIEVTPVIPNPSALKVSHSAGTEPVPMSQLDETALSISMSAPIRATYTVEVEAPEGWHVELDEGLTATVRAKPGLQGGTYCVWVTAWKTDDPSIVDSTAVQVTVLPSAPGIDLEIVKDELFTVPVAGAQLPSAFRATIQNQGPNPERVILETVTGAAGFKLIQSVTEVTIPAGETGGIGVYLEPTLGSLPLPGTEVSFTMRARSLTNGSLIDTASASLIVPEVHEVLMEAAPQIASVSPGEPIPATLRLTSLGNVDESLSLWADLPEGITLEGLPMTFDLAQGASSEIPLMLGAVSDATLNQRLNLAIHADLCGRIVEEPCDIYEPTRTVNIALTVRSRSVGVVEEFANGLERLGESQLAIAMAKLAEVLAQWEGNPNDPKLCQRVKLRLEEVLALVSENEDFAFWKSDIELARDYVLQCDPRAALELIGDTVGAIDREIEEILRHNFLMSVSPNLTHLEPGEDGQVAITLANRGLEPTTISLSLDALPAGVTATLSDTEVTLNPGKSGAATIEINQSFGTSADFAVVVTAMNQNGSVVRKGTSQFVVRLAYADVLSLQLSPQSVEPGIPSLVQGRIYNSASTRRTVVPTLEVLTLVGEPLRQFKGSPIDLIPNREEEDFVFGVIDTSGLAVGAYRVKGFLTDLESSAMLGGSAQESLLVGIPIQASVRAEPEIIAPGTSVVRTIIEVTNLLETGEFGPLTLLPSDLSRDRFRDLGGVPDFEFKSLTTGPEGEVFVSGNALGSTITQIYVYDPQSLAPVEENFQEYRNLSETIQDLEYGRGSLLYVSEDASVASVSAPELINPNLAAVTGLEGLFYSSFDHLVSNPQIHVDRNRKEILIFGDGPDSGGQIHTRSLPGNLLEDASVTLRVSSSYPGFPPERAIDGSVNTSWFLETGDAVNLGSNPFFEITFTDEVRITRVNLYGNREYADGSDIIAGRYELYDSSGLLVHQTDIVEFPPSDRDLELEIQPVENVKRFRFIPTEDEGTDPGFSEIEIIGTPQDPPANPVDLQSPNKFSDYDVKSRRVYYTSGDNRILRYDFLSQQESLVAQVDGDGVKGLTYDFLRDTLFCFVPSDLDGVDLLAVDPVSGATKRVAIGLGEVVDLVRDPITGILYVLTPESLLRLDLLDSRIKTDIVFIIDVSGSMEEEIEAVRNGLSQFLENMDSGSVSARVGLVLMEGPPQYAMDLTYNPEVVVDAFSRVSLGGSAEFQESNVSGVESGLEAIRAVLGRTPMPLYTPFLGAHSGVPAFRPDARKNVILLTDEDSDSPASQGNTLPGQSAGQDPPNDIAGTVWQEEVDITAEAVISERAFVNMLVVSDSVPFPGAEAGDPPSRQQFGDPNSDFSNDNLLGYDPFITLASLEQNGFGSSLQAQILRNGLIGRTFDIGKVDSPEFVDNFFTAKTEEVLQNPLGFDVIVEHFVEENGYEILPSSITPDPQQVDSDSIVWTNPLSGGDQSSSVFEVSGIVGASPNSGPIQISQSTTIEFSLLSGLETSVPEILRTVPPNGSVDLIVESFDIVISEAIEEASINPSAFRIVHLGRDGIIDTEDDLPVNPELISYNEPNVISLRFDGTLERGRYLVEILGGAFSDYSGNMNRAKSFTFSVFDRGVSREFSVFKKSPGPVIENVQSREFSTYLNRLNDILIEEAFSREFSAEKNPAK